MFKNKLTIKKIREKRYVILNKDENITYVNEERVAKSIMGMLDKINNWNFNNLKKIKNKDNLKYQIIKTIEYIDFKTNKKHYKQRNQLLTLGFNKIFAILKTRKKLNKDIDLQKEFDHWVIVHRKTGYVFYKHSEQEEAIDYFKKNRPNLNKRLVQLDQLSFVEQKIYNKNRIANSIAGKLVHFKYSTEEDEKNQIKKENKKIEPHTANVNKKRDGDRIQQLESMHSDHNAFN